MEFKSLAVKQAFDSVGYRVNIILREWTFFAENFLEMVIKIML